MKEKDFRIVVKVNPEDPKKALQFLSERVTGKKWLLDGTDLEFVGSQDYITAVPIEIALDMETRAKLIYLNPNVRIIVTGVPANRVAHLREYGYVVFTLDAKLDEDGVSDSVEVSTNDSTDPERPGLEVHTSSKPSDCNDKVEVPEMVAKLEKSSDNSGDCKQNYYINGNPVSREDFEAERAKFFENYKKLIKEWFS